MKKLFGLFLLLLLAFSLFSCKSNDKPSGDDPVVEVTYNKVDAKAATETQDGNSEYYIGSDGKYYVKDGNGYKEVANGSWVIPATGSQVTYTKVSAKEATETQDGNSEYYIGSDGKYYVKDGNGYKEVANGSWVIPAKGVQVTYEKVDAKTPTETEAGNAEYYIGSDGKYYVKDGDDYREVTRDSWVIPATGGQGSQTTYTKVHANDPTETEPGNYEYYIGSDGKYYALVDDVYYEVEEDSWVIPATGFNEDEEPEDLINPYEVKVTVDGEEYIARLWSNLEKIFVMFSGGLIDANFNFSLDEFMDSKDELLEIGKETVSDLFSLYELYQDSLEELEPEEGEEPEEPSEFEQVVEQISDAYEAFLPIIEALEALDFEEFITDETDENGKRLITVKKELFAAIETALEDIHIEDEELSIRFEGLKAMLPMLAEFSLEIEFQDEKFVRAEMVAENPLYSSFMKFKVEFGYTEEGEFNSFDLDLNLLILVVQVHLDLAKEEFTLNGSVIGTYFFDVQYVEEGFLLDLYTTKATIKYHYLLASILKDEEVLGQYNFEFAIEENEAKGHINFLDSELEVEATLVEHKVVEPEFEPELPEFEPELEEDKQKDDEEDALEDDVEEDALEDDVEEDDEPLIETITYDYYFFAGFDEGKYVIYFNNNIESYVELNIFFAVDEEEESKSVTGFSFEYKDDKNEIEASLLPDEEIESQLNVKLSAAALEVLGSYDKESHEAHATLTFTNYEKVEKIENEEVTDESVPEITIYEFSAAYTDEEKGEYRVDFAGERTKVLVRVLFNQDGSFKEAHYIDYFKEGDEGEFVPDNKVYVQHVVSDEEDHKEDYFELYAFVCDTKAEGVLMEDSSDYNEKYSEKVFGVYYNLLEESCDLRFDNLEGVTGELYLEYGKASKKFVFEYSEPKKPYDNGDEIIEYPGEFDETYFAIRLDSNYDEEAEEEKLLGFAFATHYAFNSEAILGFALDYSEKYGIEYLEAFYEPYGFSFLFAPKGAPKMAPLEHTNAYTIRLTWSEYNLIRADLDFDKDEYELVVEYVFEDDEFITNVFDGYLEKIVNEETQAILGYEFGINIMEQYELEGAFMAPLKDQYKFEATYKQYLADEEDPIEIPLVATLDLNERQLIIFSPELFNFSVRLLFTQPIEEGEEPEFVKFDLELKIYTMEENPDYDPEVEGSQEYVSVTNTYSLNLTRDKLVIDSPEVKLTAETTKTTLSIRGQVFGDVIAFLADLDARQLDIQYGQMLEFHSKYNTDQEGKYIGFDIHGFVTVVSYPKEVEPAPLEPKAEGSDEEQQDDGEDLGAIEVGDPEVEPVDIAKIYEFEFKHDIEGVVARITDVFEISLKLEEGAYNLVCEIEPAEFDFHGSLDIAKGEITFDALEGTISLTAKQLKDAQGVATGFAIDGEFEGKEKTYTLDMHLDDVELAIICEPYVNIKVDVKNPLNMPISGYVSDYKLEGSVKSFSMFELRIYTVMEEQEVDFLSLEGNLLSMAFEVQSLSGGAKFEKTENGFKLEINYQTFDMSDITPELGGEDDEAEGYEGLDDDLGDDEYDDEFDEGNDELDDEQGAGFEFDDDEPFEIPMKDHLIVIEFSKYEDASSFREYEEDSLDVIDFIKELAQMAPYLIAGYLNWFPEAE